VLPTLAQQAATSDASILDLLFADNNFKLVLIFGVGGLITITAILSGVIRSIMIGKAKERTRQEVAAYVAEGSMTAAEGERLLRAGDWDSDDIKREKIMHETIRSG
jgi:succinyl-CoA synthetase beta subunit